MRAVTLVLLASFCSTAGVAAAQTPAAQPAPTLPPPTAAPQPAPAPAQPPPTLPPPTAAPEPVPAPPPAPDGSTPPPPTFPAPSEAQPAPHYEPLGKPEPEIEKGDWDPWKHPYADSHRHDGFFIRLAIGLTLGTVSGDDHVFRDIDDISLDGFGINASLAIGGAIVDNLILNADLYQATLFDPSVEVDGRDIGDAGDHALELGVGDDVNIVGMGLGITYYIMPVNIYLAGSVGIGQVVFEDERGDREGSDAGFVGHAMLGKEWWVGQDWGIGVAVDFIGIAADDDVLGDIGGFAGSVLFSATYN